MANDSPKAFDLDLKKANDGNAYSLLAYFGKAAKEHGWPKSEIDKTIEKAMSGDYNNLISTLIIDAAKGLPA